MADQKRMKSAGGPAVRELAAKLRRHVMSRCTAGEKLPSEQALARQHGRSLQTAQRALAILAHEGLIERVHGSGTYVADPLPTGRSVTALFFFGEPNGLFLVPYFRDVAIGIVEVTAGTPQQVQLILGQSTRPAAITSDYIDRLGLEQFNSVVCLEVFNHDLLERLAERRITVSVDFACHRPGVSSCALEHAQCVELALEQLWQLGHRRIGYAGHVDRSATDPAHRQRLAAYEAWMQRRGITSPGRWMIPLTPWLEIPIQAELWVKGDPAGRPTAVLCDDYTWPFVEALVTLGARVPADLSVMSIARPGPWANTLERVARESSAEQDIGTLMGGPPSDLMDGHLAPLRSMVVNAVDLPFEAMGRWAMEEIFRRIEQPASPAAFRSFAGSLSPGNTVGPPP